MRNRDIKRQFWLNDNENRLLKANAKKANLNDSEYIRELICGNQVKEQPDDRFYEALKQLNGIGTNLNQIARKANSLNIVDAKYYRQVYNNWRQFMIEFKAEFLNGYDD